MRRAAALLLGVLLLGPFAAAQPASGAREIYLPGALVVGEDEVLRLGPGTRVHGPGHIEVRGALEAIGNATAPVELRVPVALLGNGTSLIEHARIVGVRGAAITVRDGDLAIRNVTFEDNLLGVLVDPVVAARVAMQDATFLRQDEAAVRLASGAETSLRRVSFHDNGFGVAAELRGGPWTLDVETCAFEGNGEHLSLDLQAADAPATARIANSTFSGADRHLVVRSLAGAAAASGDTPRIVLQGNRIEGGLVGILARGGAYLIASRDDAFEGMRIGISSDHAALALEGTRFATTERDLDLGPDARVTFAGVMLTPAPAPAPPAPQTWPLVVGAMLAAGAGVAAWRARSGAPARARHAGRAAAETAADARLPLEAPANPAPAGGTPDPLMAATLSPLERRILHDVGANPGSAQATIAARLGLSRQALHYHVKKLVAAGLVVKTPQGRVTECRLAPGVRLPPLPPEVTQPEPLEKA